MTSPVTRTGQESALVHGTARVLAARTLRPGTRLNDTSRFRDDVWSMTPAQLQAHRTDMVIDFRRVPQCFRRQAKEISYTLLQGSLPPGCEAIRSIDTIRSYSTWVRMALVWLNNRGITALADVMPADAEAYGQTVAGKRIGYDSKESHLRGFRMLWLCRTQMSESPLFDPTDLLFAQLPPAATASGRENSTSRIPEQVHAPYLVWALRWVDDFADDVLAAYTEWQELHRWTANNRRRRGVKPTAAEQAKASIAKVLARYCEEGRLLPGWRGEVNRSHLAREARIDRRSVMSYRPAGKQITAAALELGVADATHLRCPVRGQLDGKPWTAPIEYDDIEPLTRMLQTACYIVIAFFSGMRDSEVKHIERGCVSVWRDESGYIVRRRLKSLAFKGENDESGVQATWVINRAAHRAVDVLEQLQPAHHYLFSLLPPSRGYLSQGAIDQTRTTATTNTDLAAFGRWINSYCQRAGRTDNIPLVNGREWKVTTRQFRRTLAWFIARRPGGVIAGALQYRHVQVQMFEGYAGSSDSGFRHEVEAEEALARGEKLGDIILSDDFHRLTGPAAAEAENRLLDFERHVNFHGMVVNDPKRLQRLMKRHDPHIYPGQFVTCIHNPDRALCRPRGDHNPPSMNDCQPLRCRNVALTANNRAHLEKVRNDLDHELVRADYLAPLVRHRLAAQHAEIRDFLEGGFTSGFAAEVQR